MKLIRTNIYCVENLGLYFHVDIVDYVYLGVNYNGKFKVSL